MTAFVQFHEIGTFMIRRFFPAVLAALLLTGPASGQQQITLEPMVGLWVLNDTGVEQVLATLRQEQKDDSEISFAREVMTRMMKSTTYEIQPRAIIALMNGKRHVLQVESISKEGPRYTLMLDGNHSIELTWNDPIVLFKQQRQAFGLPLSQLSGHALREREQAIAEAFQRAIEGPSDQMPPLQRIMWLLNTELAVVEKKLAMTPAWAKLQGAANRTALHYAAQHNKPSLVKLLLSSGADPTQTDDNGRIALHDAVSGPGPRSLESIELLLAAGSDLNAVDRFRRTPVTQVQNPDVLKLLLQKGVETDPVALRPALENALRAENFALIQQVLDAGVNINAVLDSRQDTLLHRAAAQDNVAAVRWLLKQGADPQPAGKDGFVPLSYAARNQGLACLSALLEAGALPDGQPGAAYSPLHLAASSGKPEAVSLLLQAGADANLQPKTPTDQIGATALLLAVEEQQVECVKLLLAAGAKPEQICSRLQTPIDAANNANSPELWALLPFPGKEPRAAPATGPEGPPQISVTLGKSWKEIRGSHWKTQELGKPQTYFIERGDYRVTVEFPDGTQATVPLYRNLRLDQRQGIITMVAGKLTAEPLTLPDVVAQLERWLKTLAANPTESSAAAFASLRDGPLRPASIIATRPDGVIAQFNASPSRKAHWLLELQLTTPIN
ncbi:MAG TPA: hypothetical protein DCR55_11105 [Lentisphaeria bacterium]|nr:hypothetical protein [Lentisphaeria bacterium]